MRDTELSKHIEQALRIIADAQHDDGSFATHSSTDLEDFADAPTYRTTFAASQILICLNALAGHHLLTDEAQRQLARIREQAAAFLENERNENGSYNYWARSEPIRETLPYPDDCDDTFAALKALHGYDPSLLDGRRLAEVADILTTLEVAPGGPYRTWLVSATGNEDFQDIDPVVNAAIRAFLEEVDVRLEHLDAWLHERLEEGAFSSRYYPGTIPALYCFGRAFGTDTKLIAYARQAVPANPLEEILLLTTSLRAREIHDELRDRVLAYEDWQPHAWCIDPSREGTPAYAGAASLTAAFWLEAVALATKLPEPETVPQTAPEQHTAVKESALALCTGLGPELRAVAEELIRSNKDHAITMLPYRFAEALGERGSGIPAALLDQLARANLWGWLAYDAYDDFLDGEGDPRKLSAANLFLRNLAEEYAALESEIPGIADDFRYAMDTIDSANAWEQEACRADVTDGILTVPKELPFVTYEKLHERSIGHALPALALMRAAGYGEKERIPVEAFFEHYLIARQLHDDAHDWADDLARGQLNAVGSRVLAVLGERQVDVAEGLDELRERFWRDVAEYVVEDILEAAAEGRRAMNAAQLEDGTAFADELLGPLERSARRTLEERAQALAFMDRYGQSIQP